MLRHPFGSATKNDVTIGPRVVVEVAALAVMVLVVAVDVAGAITVPIVFPTTLLLLLRLLHRPTILLLLMLTMILDLRDLAAESQLIRVEQLLASQLSNITMLFRIWTLRIAVKRKTAWMVVWVMGKKLKIIPPLLITKCLAILILVQLTWFQVMHDMFHSRWLAKQLQHFNHRRHTYQ
jgi:preprotein translocase subunit Sec61beta